MNERPELLYAGCGGSVEQDLAARAGIPFRAIQAGALRGGRPWSVAWNGVKMAIGFVQARAIMKGFAPRAILATGGYASVPVVLAGRRARIPVLLYLPDIEPGLAVQRLARWASRVAVSFAEAGAFFEAGKVVVTGYPVRREFFEVDRTSARRRLGLAPDRPVVTVFGGSRGAHSINQAVGRALEGLLSACQVLHVCGPADYAAASARRGALPTELAAGYHLYDYLHEEMAHALAAADLVVARAGASTLGEFPALGLPSIVVPYPYSGQHQDANAEYLVRHGAAVKIADSALDADLLPTVLELLGDRQRLGEMGRRARALSRPEAAGRLAAELRALAAAPGGRI